MNQSSLTTLTYNPKQIFCDLLNLIRNTSGTHLNDLKVLDLARFAGCGNGIYIFTSENGVPLYVGRVKSQSFGQRIATHLDLREDVFFGSILKNIMSKQGIQKKEEALEWLIKNCNKLLLLTFDNHDNANDVTAELEKLLIGGLKTTSAPNGKGTGFNHQRGTAFSDEDCKEKLGILIERLKRQQ
jgi:hypothetical protein